MGINLRAREAHERSTAAMEGLQEVAGVVKNHIMVIDSLCKAVQELMLRQAALEAVIETYLGSVGVKPDDLLQEYLRVQEEKKQAQEGSESPEEEHKDG